MNKSPVVRIGNAQAFWGDRCDAAAELLSQAPDLDYLTMDYLAEVSMSILAAQRDRDPSAGYARDFVEVVASLAPYWSAGGKCRLIVNAGGLNPHGCAEACRSALERAGCRPMTLAVVSGDDVLSLLRADRLRAEFRNLDTLAEIATVADRLVTANAYVGAGPMVAALQSGADIVITGRVADPSLVVAACRHHFGWDETDWDRLAGATVAGHLIECGTQVTGGISTDWLMLPDSAHIGFPIVEVAEDGSCVVTKPTGTGGRVTEWTVKEQLLYEIGDPGNYLSPDVGVSFLGLNVAEVGENFVRVTGAQGKPRPSTLKVSATYRDGYRAAGTLTIIGSDAGMKAQRSGEIVLQRVHEAGHVLRNSMIECLEAADQCLLRVAVEADSKTAVEFFSKSLMALITAGPQGTTGYAEGRPKVHPVIRYWPCLIDRDAVNSRVEVIGSHPSVGKKANDHSESVTDGPLTLTLSPAAGARGPKERPKERLEQGLEPSGTLRDLALARSGDKGTGANIGIIARRAEDYEWLRTWLTAERVADFFQADAVESVTRYELPNLQAFNFILRGILWNSLQTDAQGKALGQRLLALPLPSGR